MLMGSWVRLVGWSGGASFPVSFCGAGLSEKAPAELDLLANKQRSCSHRAPRGDNTDPQPGGGANRRQGETGII